MENIYVLCADGHSEQLANMIGAVTASSKRVYVHDARRAGELAGKRILFAAETNEIGVDMNLLQLLLEIRAANPRAFEGAVGALIVHSRSELYTKSCATHLMFVANQLGCAFIGHPLAEAVGGLKNFSTWKKVYKDSTLGEICIMQCEKLGNRLMEYKPARVESPKITVLHSSSRKTSNTLMLWNMVEENLVSLGCSVRQIHVENENLTDCRGCSFKLCMHYGEQKSCFYGGLVVQEVFPAVEECDALVLLCPNYNDSIAANLMAVINRLTALYRQMSFYDKALFGVVVSGNSGNDTVARQLLGALNINKGFRLPPEFALMEIANDPGSIKRVQDIKEKARIFAERIVAETKK